MRAESLKGHLDALILAVLADGPLHGYAIIEKLKRRSDGAFELPEGTVYPGSAPPGGGRPAGQRVVGRRWAAPPRV